MIYRFLSFFLFFIFILNATISHAQTRRSSIWKIDGNKNNSNTFYFLYEENGKHVLNKIRVPNDQLQEILETKVFTSYKKAKKFISNQKNLAYVEAKELEFSKIQTEAPDVIWPTHNEWSWEWEQKYAEWIKENFNENFFVKYNMKTDCADVPIALRWIFARINFLPAAQITVLSDRIFSNESVRAQWSNLPTSENWYEDQKFLAGLDFILSNTYTHSLYLDSYPIWIDRSSLMLGTHFLKLRENGGHTLLVSEFAKGKKIYTLNSDLPRIVRKMDRSGFWQTTQPKFGPNSIQGGGGFLRMRWPKRVVNGFDLLPREEMPFYSLEQYASDFVTNFRKDFAEEVHKRFGVVSTPLDRYELATTRLISSFKSRVAIVENGFLFCSENDCSEGSENYEDHSTPARDKNILETIAIIKDLVLNFGEANPELITAWDTQLKETIITIENYPLTLLELVDIWEESLYSYDPNVPIMTRWGIGSK